MGDKINPTERWASLAITGPDLGIERVFCMSGFQAQVIEEIPRGKEEKPDLGEVCMLLMEHSANHDRALSTRSPYDEETLLAPFRRLAADKGLANNDANGATVLQMLNETAQKPQMQSTVGPARFPLPGGNGKPLVLVPGVAWESGFTQTVQDGLNGQPQPDSTKGREELIHEAGKCFTNMQQTIGICYDNGVEHGRSYLSQKKVAAVR